MIRRVVLVTLLAFASGSGPLAQVSGPPPQVQAQTCLAAASTHERYLLDRNLSIEITRQRFPSPANNCHDEEGRVIPPRITSEQRKDEHGTPYLVQEFEFRVAVGEIGEEPSDEKPDGRSFSLIRYIDPTFIPDVQFGLNSMGDVTPLIAGTRLPSGNPFDLQYKRDTFLPWKLESDRRFDDRVAWLHARELHFVRRAPPNFQPGGGVHFSDSPLHIRIRKIVDSCNNQVYVLRTADEFEVASRDYDWFSTFQVNCDHPSRDK